VRVCYSLLAPDFRLTVPTMTQTACMTSGPTVRAHVD
jgi:hypothetical protein